MRRSLIAAALLATGTLTVLAAPAQAYSPYPQPQYGYVDQGYGRPDWQQRREWRRERDEARIAEAARQEAWRIEQEREQRREWRRAQREHFGGGYRQW